MNNIITVYELLGLIKDGKEPKKIKFKSKTYEFDTDTRHFFRPATKGIEECRQLYYEIFEDDWKLYDILNEEVEILEEDKPIIELINIDRWAEITYEQNWKLLTHDFNLNINTVVDKINEIIDYINKKEKDND